MQDTTAVDHLSRALRRRLEDREAELAREIRGRREERARVRAAAHALRERRPPGRPPRAAA